jgi:uncharacterized membrane protein (GlpM family)
MSEPQRVQADAGQLRRTSWKEYAVRFVFGGLITAFAGLIAGRYGPVIGGLFLAFPAILPASATLIEQHSGKDKAQAATAGAAIGSVALLAFGAVIWLLSGRVAAWLVLLVALFVWIVVAVGLWLAVHRLPGFREQGVTSK